MNGGCYFCPYRHITQGVFRTTIHCEKSFERRRIEYTEYFIDNRMEGCPRDCQ